MKAVKLYDSRGNLIRSSSGGANRLYKSSNHSGKRKWIGNLDFDSYRNVSSYGRRKMLSIGRFLWANMAEVKGVVSEIADYTTNIFLPQFQTADHEWNQRTEDILRKHDRIADVRGGLSNMRLIRWNIMKSVLIDGDVFILFVKNRDGYPQFQQLPSHRVYSDFDGMLKEGKYKGNSIYDGVIYNNIGRALAYRVNETDGKNFRDISSNDMVHIYSQEWSDQFRGFSVLGQSLFDWLDISEARQFELMAQKVGASISLVESNEKGEPDAHADFLDGQNLTVEKSATGGKFEWIDDHTRYIKSGDGSKIEAFSNDRPTENQQKFTQTILRGVFYGLRWSYDYSLDQSNLGGAAMRVAVNKVNKAIRNYQDTLIEPALRRMDSWRVASLVSIGEIPVNEDMFEFIYQRGARLSADSRYDSDRDINEAEKDWLSDGEAIAARGGDFENHMRRVARERKRKSEIFAEEGVQEPTQSNETP